MLTFSHCTVSYFFLSAPACLSLASCHLPACTAPAPAPACTLHCTCLPPHHHYLPAYLPACCCLHYLPSSLPAHTCHYHLILATRRRIINIIESSAATRRRPQSAASKRRHRTRSGAAAARRWRSAGVRVAASVARGAEIVRAASRRSPRYRAW